MTRLQLTLASFLIFIGAAPIYTVVAADTDVGTPELAQEPELAKEPELTPAQKAELEESKARARVATKAAKRRFKKFGRAALREMQDRAKSAPLPPRERPLWGFNLPKFSVTFDKFLRRKDADKLHELATGLHTATGAFLVDAVQDEIAHSQTQDGYHRIPIGDPAQNMSLLIPRYHAASPQDISLSSLASAGQQVLHGFKQATGLATAHISELMEQEKEEDARPLSDTMSDAESQEHLARRAGRAIGRARAKVEDTVGIHDATFVTPIIKDFTDHVDTKSGTFTTPNKFFYKEDNQVVLFPTTSMQELYEKAREKAGDDSSKDSFAEALYDIATKEYPGLVIVNPRMQYEETYSKKQADGTEKFYIKNIFGRLIERPAPYRPLSIGFYASDLAQLGALGVKLGVSYKLEHFLRNRRVDFIVDDLLENANHITALIPKNNRIVPAGLTEYLKRSHTFLSWKRLMTSELLSTAATLVTFGGLKMATETPPPPFMDPSHPSYTIKKIIRDPFAAYRHYLAEPFTELLTTAGTVGGEKVPLIFTTALNTALNTLSVKELETTLGQNVAKSLAADKDLVVRREIFGTITTLLTEKLPTIIAAEVDKKHFTPRERKEVDGQLRQIFGRYQTMARNIQRSNSRFDSIGAQPHSISWLVEWILSSTPTFVNTTLLNEYETGRIYQLVSFVRSAAYNIGVPLPLNQVPNLKAGAPTFFKTAPFKVIREIIITLLTLRYLDQYYHQTWTAYAVKNRDRLGYLLREYAKTRTGSKAAESAEALIHKIRQFVSAGNTVAEHTGMRWIDIIMKKIGLHTLQKVLGNSSIVTKAHFRATRNVHIVLLALSGLNWLRKKYITPKSTPSPAGGTAT